MELDVFLPSFSLALVKENNHIKYIIIRFLQPHSLVGWVAVRSTKESSTIMITCGSTQQHPKLKHWIIPSIVFVV
jgi:hypothetical protein